ncbi:MAG: hypothetical protein QOG85_631, partial [Gaiellaceae bacterium]|nr:hypothetical protein [Gaiellaceae bacterium]
MSTRLHVTTLALLGGLLGLVGAACGSGSGTADVRAMRVSHCAGPRNAEVVQAVDGDYVYEAWIGCNGIGFARSVDGGKTFEPSTVVRGSRRNGLHVWDPAIAVAPDGTVYAAYMMGPSEDLFGGAAPIETAVAVSHDHGASFDRVSKLPLPASPTPAFGDRPSIAAGSGGALYVTWDYGPRRDEERIACPPAGSCYFDGGDFNAVFEKSADGGKTWTPLHAISPGYPLGGVYSAPIVVEPSGALGVLYLQHPTDPDTRAVSPGHEYFIRSTDGGSNWSKPVLVGSQAYTLGVKEWWIDGSLALGPDGTLYAGWDSQVGSRDTGWFSWSTDGGKHWSSPVRVASSRSEHLTEVAAAGPGDVYVGWQTVIPGKGYATFLRRYSLDKGWTGPAVRVSTTYGSA